MKSQKGITLTSLIIYVLVVIVVTGILATIMAGFQSNIKEINGKAAKEAEFDKFNVYFIKEVKILGNKVNTISEAKNEISFESGNKYTFNEADNSIYLNDNIKISENIQRCTFSNNLVDGKDVVTVVIKVIDGEERTIEYVLNGTTNNLAYDDESNYVHQSSNKGPWSENLKEGTVTNGKVTLNVGDYVDYTPKPEKTIYEKEKLGEKYTGYSNAYNNTDFETDPYIKWRVLRVDENGFLTLISTEPTTKVVLYLGSARVYNNGVYLLNDICEKLYSNTELGIKARSLTIEDVEAGFNDDGKKARNDYINSESNTAYGETKTYTTNLQYPVIYDNEKGSGVGTTTVKEKGIGISEPYYTESTLNISDKQTDTASSNLTCTQTYYEMHPVFESDYYENYTFYEMIHWRYGVEGSLTWLASRCVDCGSNLASFCLFFVGSQPGEIGGGAFMESAGSPGTGSGLFRPVVTLGSNIDVEACSGDNSVDNPHKLIR